MAIQAVPFVYGSVAFWQGRRSDESATHRWHLYVRGLNNEDLSPVVSRVLFQLHPSFAKPTRVVDKAPFGVEESGWGEFEAKITIFFHEPEDAAVEVRHFLRLFPFGPDAAQATVTVGLPKRPVISEAVDEVIFRDPSKSLLERIDKLSILPPGPLDPYCTPPPPSSP
jgi:YEATS domain-containing protein 4